MDYTEVKYELDVIANEFSRKVARVGTFKGKNFMTNNIVAQRKLPNGECFELSYGTGIFQPWVFGVTFSKNKKKSRCCSDFDEVWAILELASKCE